MGIVYRASDPTIDREVALKVLSISDAHEEGTHSPQEMFMREVRAAGRLAHPAIVVIYDAFDDHVNQTSCIVMELVPGMTLEKILESGHPLTMEQFHSIIRQVADGLDYAHKNHVIHRDLKPANILVTEDGRAKITDFGIAKVLAREGVARTIGIMGTPSYMSPEQVRGGEVDARSDIFSLGIIIYTMLTGQKPFSGNTAAVMFKIVYEEPALPSSVNAQLTPHHDQMIKKCLAKDRNQRYASARELLDDLEDLQQGRPLRSLAAKPSPRPAPPPAPSAAARPAAPPAPPPSAPVSDKTLAMPIPGLIKEAAKLGSPPPPPKRPAPPAAPPPRIAPPPPRPPSASPGNPLETRGPAPSPPAAPPSEHTVAMPIAGLMKSMAGSSTPPTPSAPPQAPPPTAPPSERTVAMPIAGLMKSMSGSQPPQVAVPLQASPPLPRPVVPPPVRFTPPPEAHPLGEHTLPMQVPDLSGLSGSPPAPPRVASPVAQPDSPLMERTLPMQVPDLSHAQPAAPPPAPPVAPSPEYFPEMERTVPSPLPDYSPLPPAAGPVVAPPPPSYLPTATSAMPPVEAPAPVASAPKSNLIPALIGGVVAVFLVAAALVGYWKFHQARTAPPPPPQVAVQTPPVVTPPPVPTPEAVPTPPPAPVVAPALTPAPVNTAPGATKKPAARKQKQATTHAAAPAPPPPPAPAPVVVAPPPAAAPSTPSPEELAKAEAARLAKIPRIVQVSCNFGMKEAMLIFSAGGNALFEESLRGKKMKGGFLGIKGSYQGTFSHTITVPAGVSDISIRVTSKDGSTDLTKAIKMPPPGGFVPTLAVAVDSEHLSLGWTGSSAAK
jgi:serine/threonine-protein kinase